MLIFSIL